MIAPLTAFRVTGTIMLRTSITITVVMTARMIANMITKAVRFLTNIPVA